ncbi:unnamed protein product [Linum trigynum]|uniref:Uncharacterized protein n=1 Tax=Linum trigynum TaxID=586398 RepID=A0AAV2EWF5_9ROSI
MKVEFTFSQLVVVVYLVKAFIIPLLTYSSSVLLFHLCLGCTWLKIFPCLVQSPCGHLLLVICSDYLPLSFPIDPAIFAGWLGIVNGAHRASWRSPNDGDGNRAVIRFRGNFR